VLDLPQLYTKPSATAILDALALLTTAPPSWELNANDQEANDQEASDASSKHKSRNAQTEVRVNPEGVARYLTSIISSTLKWIEDDEVKEEIWNQTSLRLSERSGRAAMGSFSRTFRIPSESGSFELSIYEPAMTGDDLGLKTWGTSYMLAKRLHRFDLASLKAGGNLQVLELGAGTGLVGFAMASLGADVVLTDLPNIHDNLARNAKDNSETIEQSGGSSRTGILDWTNPASCQLFADGSAAETLQADTNKFPLILAADSLYSPDHPRMLVDCIQAWLSHDSKAKVIVELPYRDAYLPEIKNFRQRMQNIGLCILEEGEESGYDDWSGGGAEDGDERTLVTCWWSYWGRTEVTA
jgi:predicted nicotinamide N-methyase